jgi:predicted acylesterase/phospholipase RssA
VISDWKSNQFKIAINMAGAVSAGAYTAGVLDFLMEALEEWQKAKDEFRAKLANPEAAVPITSPVPLHDVSIEAFSGASAGGMCAAIASVMVQGTFVHITDANARNTNNTFYEAWVNQIDISKLLTANDLKNGAPLVSLLDSTIIDTIAESALTPGPHTPRTYISDGLTRAQRKHCTLMSTLRI